MLKDIRLFTFRIVFRPQTKSYYLSRWSRESCCSSVVAINRLLQTPSFLFFCRYISDANKKALCLCCVQDYKSHLKTKFGQGQDTIIAVLSLGYLYVQNVDHYHLDLPIRNASSPTSHRYLRTASNLLYLTWQQKCLALGLVKNCVIWGRAVSWKTRMKNFQYNHKLIKIVLVW